MKGHLAIRDVAERTGLAAGTIRMWEQRYGAPVPGRSDSGYRLYSQDDVEMLRRAVAFRRRGGRAAIRACGTGGRWSEATTGGRTRTRPVTGCRTPGR